ncbi:MAG: hypothetical protein MR428_05360 [Mesosutterella sp.]|nr:hypothetical protein [Mesosutterella sp.]
MFIELNKLSLIYGVKDIGFHESEPPMNARFEEGKSSAARRRGAAL